MTGQSAGCKLDWADWVREGQWGGMGFFQIAAWMDLQRPELGVERLKSSDYQPKANDISISSITCFGLD